MSVLDEIRGEILENAELDVNEKLCLVALLCSGDIADMKALSGLMGTTPVTAQMAVRSLRLKGYLRNEKLGSEEAEINALKKLLEKEAEDCGERRVEEERRASRVIKASVVNEDAAAVQKPEVFDEFPAEQQNTRISRVAALYKKEALMNAGAKGVQKPVHSGLEHASAEEDSPVDRVLANMTAAKAEKSSGVAGSSKSDEDRVMELIDEAITRSEAAIILGFARGDLDKVEKMYNRVRGTQIKDKIDALVKLLQANQ